MFHSFIRVRYCLSNREVRRMARSKVLADLLSSFSRDLDVFIAILAIVLGIYLYFVGFEDIRILITISSLTVVIYGIKRILDAIIRTMLGKELERLVAERKE